MSHKRVLPLIDAKDREFFQRIAKNRVDASLQSPTKAVPDYYGTLHAQSLEHQIHSTSLQVRRLVLYTNTDRYVIINLSFLRDIAKHSVHSGYATKENTVERLYCLKSCRFYISTL